MTRIWERLYLGSLTDADRLSRSNSSQIATVISVSEQCVEHKTGKVHYIHLPIEDDKPVPVHQFNAVINALAVNISQGVVLLHCGLGISRAPTLAAAYLHRTGYKNFDAAMEEIRQVRPSVDPSKILMSSVKEQL